MAESGRWRDALIAAASALAVAAALYPFTAKPFTLSWDELVYMDLAFRPAPAAWRLNRYAHIYALLPFTRLSGDPYLGARLFWSCAVGLTVGVLVRAALCEPKASRPLAVILVLLFFAGQEDVFDFPGIAYAEYTAMPAVAAAFCLVWTRLARGQTLSERDAAAVGLLTLIAIKSTELALPVLVLPAVLLVTPAGGVRLDCTTLRLAACWVGGVTLGFVALMTLDFIFLGDPLFSVRPSTWSELNSYNLQPVVVDSFYEHLRWFVRPEISRALALYAVSGAIWFGVERDVRLRTLYALPVVFSALLGLLEVAGRLGFVPRYTLPDLPLLCFFPAVALSRVVAAGGQRQARPMLTAFAVALAIGVVAVSGGHMLASLLGVSVDRVERVVSTVLVLAAAVGLIAVRNNPRRMAIVVSVVAATALFPAWRVATELLRRDAQRAGNDWFPGFYEVARSASVERDATIFVSDRLYDGAIRAGIIPALTRLNFNLRLEPRQILRGAAPSSDADYAVVSAAEWDAWRAAKPDEALDAIVSTDRQVALVCLHGTCPRPR